LTCFGRAHIKGGSHGKAVTHRISWRILPSHVARKRTKGVFKSQKDREKFLSYVESAVVRYGAVVHTWCLMRNHYHLLLETPSGNLAQIMRHINGAYTTYCNVKRKRAGHLFQGRYQATLVEADAYAVELSRSMHLNPVRAGMVPNLSNTSGRAIEATLANALRLSG